MFIQFAANKKNHAVQQKNLHTTVRVHFSCSIRIFVLISMYFYVTYGSLRLFAFVSYSTYFISYFNTDIPIDTQLNNFHFYANFEISTVYF